MGHPEALCRCKSTHERIKDRNGTDLIVLRNPRGETAQVNLQGGHVSSWRNDQGEDLLFTSTKIPKPPKAMRGGIPICFPKFDISALSGVNGYARNRGWIIDENPPPLKQKDYQEKSFIDLLLKPSKDDLKCWPYSFEFRHRVSLAHNGNLNMISRIRNIGNKPFSFSFGYHTYLSVSDISEVRIEGLETLDYLDNLSDKKRFTEQGDAITFESEVDRAYLLTPKCIAVLDHGKKRTFVIQKEGLPDAVVWNPWEKKAKAMTDFADGEYKKMVCVDGAAVERPITLKPGDEWTGRLGLLVVYSSFCTKNLDSRLKHF